MYFRYLLGPLTPTQAPWNVSTASHWVGHSSIYCHLLPYCMCCAELHHGCNNLQPGTPSKCCNSDRVHQANYQGCSMCWSWEEAELQVVLNTLIKKKLSRCILFMVKALISDWTPTPSHFESDSGKQDSDAIWQYLVLYFRNFQIVPHIANI